NRNRRVQLHVESLEGRQLMSAGVLAAAGAPTSPYVWHLYDTKTDPDQSTRKDDSTGPNGYFKIDEVSVSYGIVAEHHAEGFDGDPVPSDWNVTASFTPPPTDIQPGAAFSVQSTLNFSGFDKRYLGAIPVTVFEANVSGLYGTMQGLTVNPSTVA